MPRYRATFYVPEPDSEVPGRSVEGKFEARDDRHAERVMRCTIRAHHGEEDNAETTNLNTGRTWVFQREIRDESTKHQ
jgi:hypothetical protein